ncbi:hypothetical protein [Bacillus sp. FJAT-47783]|nr:hypothetical protein [Bacillus sp. FJAT-47783]
MRDAYHLAQLSSEQKEKINQVEKELDVVLVAWEPYEDEGAQH